VSRDHGSKLDRSGIVIVKLQLASPFCTWAASELPKTRRKLRPGLAGDPVRQHELVSTIPQCQPHQATFHTDPSLSLKALRLSGYAFETFARLGAELAHLFRVRSTLPSCQVSDDISI
jgi:hypothetical protein